MIARCIYTGIEPLVWRVCVHVSPLSLSLSRTRALSLSRSLSLKKFCIVVLLSALSRAYMQALGLISRCYKCLQQFMCTYAAYKEYQV